MTLRPAVTLAAAVLAVVSTGCKHDGPATTPGAPVAARATIAAIQVCTTTEADLRAALGAPTRDGRLADARIVSWIVSDDDVTAYLAVLLAPDGRVVDLYWDVPTEIPWTPRDRCAPAPP